MKTMKYLLILIIGLLIAISCEKDDYVDPSVTTVPQSNQIVETWSEWTPDFEDQTEDFVQNRTNNTGATEERTLVLTRNVIDDSVTCCYQEQEGTGDINDDGDLEDWLIGQEVYYTATVNGAAIESNTPVHDEFEVAKDFSGNFIEDFTKTAFVKKSRYDIDLLEFNEDDLSYTISPLKYGSTNNFETCWETPEVTSILDHAVNIGWYWSSGGKKYYVYSPDITWDVEVERDRIRYVFNLDTKITTLAGDLERLDLIQHWDRDYIKNEIQEKIDALDGFVVEIRRTITHANINSIRVSLKTFVYSKRKGCINEFTGMPEECNTHSYSPDGQYYTFQYEMNLVDPEAPVNNFLPEELPSDPLEIDKCN